MTSSRVPSLSDLVCGWLKDAMPENVFKAIHFNQISEYVEWYILYFGGIAVAFIDDDFVLLLDSEQTNQQKVYAADPEFFNKLGDYIKIYTKIA